MKYDEEARYLEIAKNIVNNGYVSNDRTGTGIRKTHVEHMSFDLSGGRIPILSTRKIAYKNAIVEMLWFISGSTDVKFLKDNNCPIWDSWVIPETATYDQGIDLGIKLAQEKGLIKLSPQLNSSSERLKLAMKYGDAKLNDVISDLTGLNIPHRRLLSGSIGQGAYGSQWRFWEDIRAVAVDDQEQKDKLIKMGYETINEGSTNDNKEAPKFFVLRKSYDQLQEAIDLINNNPESRRIIVNAWNPGKLDLAVLPPCHFTFQFLPYEKDGEKLLDIALTCRSQDFLLGTVFNVLQYSVLCHIVGKLTGRKATRLFWTGNNTHIYNNQLDIFKQEHSEREPQELNSRVVLKNRIYVDIDDFTMDDITVVGYEDYLEPIKYPVAV